MDHEEGEVGLDSQLNGRLLEEAASDSHPGHSDDLSPAIDDERGRVGELSTKDTHELGGTNNSEDPGVSSSHTDVPIQHHIDSNVADLPLPVGVEDNDLPPPVGLSDDGALNGKDENGRETSPADEKAWPDVKSSDSPQKDETDPAPQPALAAQPTTRHVSQTDPARPNRRSATSAAPPDRRQRSYSTTGAPRTSRTVVMGMRASGSMSFATRRITETKIGRVMTVSVSVFFHTIRTVIFLNLQAILLAIPLVGMLAFLILVAMEEYELLVVEHPTHAQEIRTRIVFGLVKSVSQVIPGCMPVVVAVCTIGYQRSKNIIFPFAAVYSFLFAIWFTIHLFLIPDAKQGSPYFIAGVSSGVAAFFAGWFVAFKVKKNIQDTSALPAIFWTYATPQFAIIALIAVYIAVLPSLYLDSGTLGRAAIRLFIHPVLSEAVLILSRLSMMRYAIVEDQYIANVFVLFPMAFVAFTGRFLITALGGVGEATIVAVIVGIQEVISRATLSWRTRLVRKILRKIKEVCGFADKPVETADKPLEEIPAGGAGQENGGGKSNGGAKPSHTTSVTGRREVKSAELTIFEVADIEANDEAASTFESLSEDHLSLRRRMAERRSMELSTVHEMSMKMISIILTPFAVWWLIIVVLNHPDKSFTVGGLFLGMILQLLVKYLTDIIAMIAERKLGGLNTAKAWDQRKAIPFLLQHSFFLTTGIYFTAVTLIVVWFNILANLES